VGDRPKHPKKDIEALMREAEDRGWVFERGNGYYKGKCGCEGKHIKTIHLSPSNPRYVLNAQKWFERTCWKDER